MRPRSELTHHILVSLTMLGVMMVFFAALVRAERREVAALRHPVRDPMTLSFAESLAEVEAASSSSAGFGLALFIAAIGTTIAASALFLRRPDWWVIAASLTLACLVTSTHAFATTRTKIHALRELSHAGEPAPMPR